MALTTACLPCSMSRSSTTVSSRHVCRCRSRVQTRARQNKRLFVAQCVLSLFVRLFVRDSIYGQSKCGKPVLLRLCFVRANTIVRVLIALFHRQRLGDLFGARDARARHRLHPARNSHSNASSLRGPFRAVASSKELNTDDRLTMHACAALMPLPRVRKRCP